MALAAELHAGCAQTHPVALPEIAINAFWHARFHRDPGNQWLRGVLFEQFADGR